MKRPELLEFFRVVHEQWPDDLSREQLDQLEAMTAGELETFARGFLLAYETVDAGTAEKASANDRVAAELRRLLDAP